MSKKYYVHEKYRPRSRRAKAAITAVFVAVLIVLSVIAVRHVYFLNLAPLNGKADLVEVTVPRGADVDQITDILDDNQLLKSPWAFKLYVRNENAANTLQAGTYGLRSNMSVNEIVAVLSRGKVTTDLVTILPGQTLAQIRQTLIKNGFDAEKVDEALLPDNYSQAPVLVDKPGTASLEGFLFPESFQKTNDTEPQTIINGSLTEMQRRLTPALRDSFASQGLSTYQGLILASIVEKEASKASDRAQVAQVFLSRLRQNISLGSDPTAFYGAVLAGQKPSVAHDSPYNTRIYAGLPPTPISTVSESSLRAVANPATTDWLFFVAGDDGTTYFSRTLKEHEALTKQYCTRLCQ